MQIKDKVVAVTGAARGIGEAIAHRPTRIDPLAGMPPEWLERVAAPTPSKRLGQPAEITRAAVLIAENDYFSGRSIDIDSGMRL